MDVATPEAAPPRKKKVSFWQDLRDRALYGAVRVVAAALQCFPVDTNLRTARFLGTLIWAVDKKHRDRAMANLRRSFPQYTERQCRALGRRSMQQMVMLFVEVLFTTRLIRFDSWADYVELKDFESVLAMLLRRERGLIMLTGHYGNWEILGYVLATLGFETVSIARPLDNRYVSRYLFEVREKTGQKIIAKKGATPEITAELDRQGTVAFIADQNAGSKGIFVDFFGRKASTYKSIGLLAMQYNVPIVIGYARRIDGRFHFRCAAQDIIYPQDWQSQNDPLRYITQRYTAAIEQIVRDDPGQYWWVHRRWKTRPKGETVQAFD